MEMNTLPTRIFLVPNTRLFSSNTLRLSIAKPKQRSARRFPSLRVLPINELQEKHIGDTRRLIAEDMDDRRQHRTVDRWFARFGGEN